MISIDIIGTDLILLTDNPTLPEIFKYDSGSMVFDFKTKQMVWGSKNPQYTNLLEYLKNQD